MKGFPKHLNCKMDYLNLLDDFPDETRARLQVLLDTRKGWVVTGKLEDGAEGVTDETHEVRELTDDEGNVTERYQYEYMDDPGSELARIGFTVEEVEEMINA